ncbi:MAG: hypothetical protein R3C15_23710 [Thermoleophilia bacterium]
MLAGSGTMRGGSAGPAGAGERPEGRDAEGDAERERDLGDDEPGDIAAQDDVELVDQEEGRADDGGDAE